MLHNGANSKIAGGGGGRGMLKPNRNGWGPAGCCWYSQRGAVCWRYASSNGAPYTNSYIKTQLAHLKKSAKGDNAAWYPSKARPYHAGRSRKTDELKQRKEDNTSTPDISAQHSAFRPLRGKHVSTWRFQLSKLKPTHIPAPIWLLALFVPVPTEK